MRRLFWTSVASAAFGAALALRIATAPPDRLHPMIPALTIGLRCSLCGVTWPAREDYQDCPECGETTSPCSNVSPLELSEAESRRKHAAFERWLEEHGRA